VHWRTTSSDVADFRGVTVPVDVAEVAVKPSGEFVAALAPVVDTRLTSVPASLADYAVDGSGTVVVDGRDLIYFGASASVPLEGRDPAV
jgi:hypothetical protein